MKNKIIVIDQTIREGMQHKGIVFSLEQKQKILEFQEKLNIDICQAGYAPAHKTEAESINLLNTFVQKSKFNIAVAGMGRALVKDAQILIETGINHFHLHFQIREESQKSSIFANLLKTVNYIRENTEKSIISIAMLDMGKTSDSLIKEVVKYLADTLCVDIISLPDTSGIMPPNLIFEKIKAIIKMINKPDMDKFIPKISTHCHNDMGMANANAVMAVCAGARVIETSALGIGERNGISDLFITSLSLKQQGFDLNVNIDDIETFKKYYNYINLIYQTQTNQSLITFNTPVFGDGVKSHVAGTHALPSDKSGFGMFTREKYYINLLCGTHLVEKYLKKENISFDPANLKAITAQIKLKSAQQKRRLYKKEIIEISKRYI